MAHWSLDDIPWQAFDRSKAAPELVSLIKSACMVEHNGADYGRYLREVFHDDPEFCVLAEQWSLEEIQHGQALRQWSELADPEFDFDKSFAIFTDGFKLPENVQASVRGSRCGELIARCVVEAGTSAYYTALKDYTGEPVLQILCARIAADEFRHYKLFYSYLKSHLARERLSLPRRIRIALSRITESGDDELAYAFFAAHSTGRPFGNGNYSRKRYRQAYLSHAASIYRRPHIEKMSAMILKAAGLKSSNILHRITTALAWRVMRLHAGRLESAA